MVAEVRELRRGLGFSAEEGNKTEMSALNIKAEGEGIEPVIVSGRENRGKRKEPKEDRMI